MPEKCPCVESSDDEENARDDDDDDESESSNDGGIPECIFKIPCCGGWCAPTENPDETCFRHLSNEYTLSGAPMFMRVAPIVEYSHCCIACGRSGCKIVSSNRKKFAIGAAFITFLGLALSIYSLLGASTNASLIHAAHWSHGRARITTWYNGTMDVYIGLNAQLRRLTCDDVVCENSAISRGFVDNGDGHFEKIVEWRNESSCNADETDACVKCKQSALGTEMTVIGSCITLWPQFITNMQRSTVFGDVNCQSTLGALTTIGGALSSIAALSVFRLHCDKSMPTEISGASCSWNVGPGFICLLFATLLKATDFIYHMVLPTPPARWKKPKGNAAIDIVEYLKLAQE